MFVVEQAALNKKDKTDKTARLLGFLSPLLSFLLNPTFHC
jgi:hypothetical protein